MLFTKLFLLFLGLTTASSKPHKHFYRKDYTFFEEYDAFYKLHWDIHGISWSSAFLKCDDEGAKLFYPKEEGEWKIAKNLTGLLPVAPNVSEMFVGIHDEFGLGEFITIDGHSTPTPLGETQITSDGKNCVLMDMETGAYRVDSCSTDDPEYIRPFMCRKIDDKPCPTIDRGYIYEQSTKKCYKVNDRPKAWQEASHTCFMEGGILVVVENEAESDIINNKVENYLNYFAGFRKIFTENVFYTIKGQKLNDGAFHRWYERHIEDNHDCGVVYSYDGQLYIRSTDCFSPLPFVCEMEAKT